jgi:hypothetical protein
MRPFVPAWQLQSQLANPSTDMPTYEYNGTTLYYGISPCSWMYSYYGLQIRVSLSASSCNRESIFLNNKASRWSKAKDMDAAAVTLLEENLSPDFLLRLQAAVSSWQEDCASYDKAHQIAVTEFEARCAQAKEDGYVYHTRGIGHPVASSDYTFDFFSRAKPTQALVFSYARCCYHSHQVRQTQPNTSTGRAITPPISYGNSRW